LDASVGTDVSEDGSEEGASRELNRLPLCFLGTGCSSNRMKTTAKNVMTHFSASTEFDPCRYSASVRALRVSEDAIATMQSTNQRTGTHR